MSFGVLNVEILSAILPSSLASYVIVSFEGTKQKTPVLKTNTPLWSEEAEFQVRSPQSEITFEVRENLILRKDSILASFSLPLSQIPINTSVEEELISVTGVKLIVSFYYQVISETAIDVVNLFTPEEKKNSPDKKVYDRKESRIFSNYQTHSKKDSKASSEIIISTPISVSKSNSSNSSEIKTISLQELFKNSNDISSPKFDFSSSNSKRRSPSISNNNSTFFIHSNDEENRTNWTCLLRSLHDLFSFYSLLDFLWYIKNWENPQSTWSFLIIFTYAYYYDLEFFFLSTTILFLMGVRFFRRRREQNEESMNKKFIWLPSLLEYLVSFTNFCESIYFPLEDGFLLTDPQMSKLVVYVCIGIVVTSPFISYGWIIFYSLKLQFFLIFIYFVLIEKIYEKYPGVEEKFNVKRVYKEITDYIRRFILSWGEFFFELEYSESPDSNQLKKAYFMLTSDNLLAYTDSTKKERIKHIHFDLSSSWGEIIIPFYKPTLFYRQKKTNSTIYHIHDTRKETNSDIFFKGSNLKLYLPLLKKKFNEKSSYLVQDLDLTTNIELLPLAIKISKLIEIRNRSHNLKTYKQCWISVDFAAKVQEFEKTITPEQLGMFLQSCGLIYHVAKKEDFQIGHHFYRFYPDMQLPILRTLIGPEYSQIKPIEEAFENATTLDISLEAGRFMIGLIKNDEKATSIKFKVSYLFYPPNQQTHLLLSSFETPILKKDIETYFGPFSLPNPGGKIHLSAELYSDVQKKDVSRRKILYHKNPNSSISIRVYEHELKIEE